MSKIYKLRSVNDTTIDELKNGYLWFSRPTEFKDVEDSNIIGFAENNENIKNAFDRVFSNNTKFAEGMSYIGICCFTETLPHQDKWSCFPKGHNGIFIEYDKDNLEEYFYDEYYLADCFRKVEYFEEPLVIQSSTDQGYDVLWEKYEDGVWYKSIEGSIMRDQRVMDEFLFKLLTRINDKYINQRELRIIWSGPRIREIDTDAKGYKVNIPIDFITRVYIQKTTPKDFITKILEYIDESKIECID